MKETIKNSVVAGIVAIAMSLGTLGVVGLVKDEPINMLPENFDITDHIDLASLKGADGIDGTDGLRGYRGYTGVEGTDGVDGVDGEDGSNAEIDIDELTDEVADEMEDREDGEVFSLRCVEGTTTYDFTVPDDGVYRFEFRHYGSGNFNLFLTDESDDDTDILSGSGNRTKTSTLSLNDNEVYRITIDSDASCKLIVEEN